MTAFSKKSPIQAAAATLLAKRKTSSVSKISSLQEFITLVNPNFIKPVHLKDYTDRLEDSERTPQRLLLSVPPRHGKSETTALFCAWYLLRNPTHKIAYICYGEDLARKVSEKIRSYAEKAGLALDKKHTSLSDWGTALGGGVKATGLSGTLTGLGFDIIIVDDPHKNESEAASSTIRQSVIDWYRGTCASRPTPRGSVFIVHTRWHPEDLIGTLSKDKGWDYINFPVFNEEGNALWPEVWSRDVLEVRKAESGIHQWAAIYMGQPIPKGGALFEDVHFYDPKELPQVGQDCIGIDLSYTAKTKSDYSVALVLRKYQDQFFIIDMVRKQAPATEFAKDLMNLKTKYAARMFSFIGGVERGPIDFLKERGIHIIAQVAKSDKFTRAQAVSACWNAGKILLPRSDDIKTRIWVDGLVSEITSFTGKGDKHDDQVDALVNAFACFCVPTIRRNLVNLPSA